MSITMQDMTTSLALKPGVVETPSPPSVLSAAPTPISLLMALRRRWRLALTCATVFGLLVGTAAWLFVPEGKFTARTKLRVPVNPAFLPKDSPAPLNLVDHQRLQVAMVKSRLVLSAALKNPKAAGLSIIQEKAEPLEWLERELMADFNSAPEVLRISLDGHERDQLKKIVDAIRDAYCEMVLDKEASERVARLAEVKRMRDHWDNKLKTRREERKAYEQIAGGREPAIRAMGVAFAQQQLIGLERELLGTEAAIRRTKGDLAALSVSRAEGTDVNAPETLIEDRLSKEPAYQSLAAKISRKRTDIEEAQAVLTPGVEVFRVQQMQRELEESEKAQKELRIKLLPRITEEIKKHVQNNLEFAERDLRIKLVVLEKEQTALAAQVEKGRADLQKQADGAGKLDVIKDDMTHIEDFRKSLGREEEKLELEIKAAPPRYTLLEEGLATRPPERARRLIIASGSGVAAFVVVLALFAFLEFRGRRVNGPDEMTYGLGLPVVATIPDNAIRGKGRQVHSESKALMSEAIDTFRTMLIKAGESEPMRVIMITSAHSGEGKTSLSTHLAASLAQVGYATLLVDGDLRNPLAHRVFELGTTPGLCDLLRGDATLEELIRTTPIDRLWMVTAGEWDENASRALAREKTREMVEKLRARFDFVIIDSSPVLPVVDPLLLGTCADAAVISVLREKSRMPLVYAAYQRLIAGGVRVLGTVVNGVQGEQYGVYYAYRQQPAEA